MIDLDKFKEINTKYGHQGGDEVLRQVTNLIMKARVREDEIFARWGGEEFVLILPNAKHKQAVKIAEQICSLVENGTITYKTKAIKVTVSIGAATLEYKKWNWAWKNQNCLKKQISMY